MKSRRLPFIIAAIVGGASTATAQPEVSLPIACELGETCFVQKYVDVDPSGGIADHQCGTMTSEDHKGTDFRIVPGTQVDVLAPADGVVLRMRDGEADRSFADELKVDPQRACGNAVLIEHDGGYSSLLCHMAEGSVGVAPGDEVARGDPIGRVGASGSTGFRHVHFQLMDPDGTVLDPFTGHAMGTAACDTAGEPLWTKEAAGRLATMPRTHILAAGFNDGPVSIPAIEDDALAGEVGPNASALVAYGMAIGVEAGDTERLTLTGPDFEMDERWPIERPRAQVMRFMGRRLREGLAPGTYRMWYGIIRGGEVIASQDEVMLAR